jgi:hypothetical protein
MRKPFSLASGAGTPSRGRLIRGKIHAKHRRMEEPTMKTLLSGVALAAIVAVALPAWSQPNTMQGQSTQQNAPGTGGTSKPGVPGLPGSESGPTVTPSGTTVPEASRTRPDGDESKVPGLPGSKSGPTEKPSSLGR